MIIEKNIIVIFVLTLLIPLWLFGKSAGALTGQGHSGDITRILGVDANNAKQRELAQKICDDYARVIDSQNDANKLNSEIKEIAPGFSWGIYTHRIFFHWGFNGDPHHSKALSASIKDSGASPNDTEKIWKLILEVQRQRNKEMLDSVKGAVTQKNGNCALTRDELNAISSLIYDVHILGDYVEGTAGAILALQEFDELTGDIINASRKLGSTDYKSLNALRTELNKAKMSGLPSQKAEKMLEVMEAYIPLLIKSSPRVSKALY